VVIPDPEVGLVIHFNFLWKRERDSGRDNARYARPCAIVVARRIASGGQTIVIVAPVTHSPPTTEDVALEIPAAVKRHLGLDENRSWIVYDEVNEFAWPGYDLQPNAKGEIAYGVLPPGLFERLRRAMFHRLQSGRLNRVIR
jgi:hypothetical protein